LSRIWNSVHRNIYPPVVPHTFLRPEFVPVDGTHE
jgi:hypothetical protein